MTKLRPHIRFATQGLAMTAALLLGACDGDDDRPSVVVGGDAGTAGETGAGGTSAAAGAPTGGTSGGQAGAATGASAGMAGSATAGSGGGGAPEAGSGGQLSGIFGQWQSSGHADTEALAFNDWNAEDPPEIPVDCARCHSRPGFLDYLGADGSDEFVVDNPAPIGTVVDCDTCHNDKAITLDQVTFPSEVTVTGLGPEARCMTCHQGRSSKDDVDAHITTAAPADDDTVSTDLRFQNIHYLPAAATRLGSDVRGGYQYDDATYVGPFEHVVGMQACQDCHDPHSTSVRTNLCGDCHSQVESTADLRDIRMSSLDDYDGDGDAMEGLYFEIEGLRPKLLEAMQTYATNEVGADICYEGHTYPYFFIDTDGNGACETAEAAFANQYASWTPRLLRAAYNYQFSTRDPGAYAHNPRYMIQLVHDSVVNVNAGLPVPDQVDLTGAVRPDAAL